MILNLNLTKLAKILTIEMNCNGFSINLVKFHVLYLYFSGTIGISEIHKNKKKELGCFLGCCTV